MSAVNETLIRDVAVLVPKAQLKIARRFNAGSNHPTATSPEGAIEVFSRPFGTRFSFPPIPALKRRAIVESPSGTGESERLSPT